MSYDPVEKAEEVIPVPMGRGDIKDKKNKKKSKEQMEKELKRQGTGSPVIESMTFEVVKPKRKERDQF